MTDKTETKKITVSLSSRDDAISRLFRVVRTMYPNHDIHKVKVTLKDLTGTLELELGFPEDR